MEMQRRFRSRGCKRVHPRQKEEPMAEEHSEDWGHRCKLRVGSRCSQPRRADIRDCRMACSACLVCARPAGP